MSAGPAAATDAASMKNAADALGFSPHIKSTNCLSGCSTCQAFRAAVNWPGDCELLANSTAYKKADLLKLCGHFNVTIVQLAGKRRQRYDVKICNRRSCKAFSAGEVYVQQARARVRLGLLVQKAAAPQEVPQAPKFEARHTCLLAASR